jgi:tryptophanyl-tRNA synthetase
MALDDPSQKMSKSAKRPNASISLADAPETIAKKIKSAVTDSGREVTAGEDKPALTNLLTIFSAMEGTPVGELEAAYRDGGYATFKQALTDAVVEHLRPIRKRYEDLIGEPTELESLLDAGARRAYEVAEQTMVDVRARVGLGHRP